MTCARRPSAAGCRRVRGDGFRLALAGAMAAIFAAGAPGQAAAGPCREDQIDLRGPQGAARFVVEIADDDEERARGLMFREEMAASHGMLFLFDPPRPVAFWMRNTPLPLDLIFMDAAGRVLNVIADATPFSEEHLPSDGVTRAVLEVNAGLAARYGIGPGTQARHPGFGEDADWPC
ncbi:MAG: DUF192 domain-containing protein [Pseudomonadota bacterium]|nr:DUF192 domain-containing protein [Pseudomonadota bacterium]